MITASIERPAAKPGSEMFSMMPQSDRRIAPATASGSFLAVPEQSTASSQTALIPNHPGGQRGRHGARRWLLAAAAVAIAAGGFWWLTATAVPITDRAWINARLAQVTSPIAGLLAEQSQQAPRAVVHRGDVLARIHNPELDHARRDMLQERTVAVQSRAIAVETALGRAKSELERISRDIGAAPDAVDAALRLRLRDELTARMAELTSSLEDLRIQQNELSVEHLAEERRLAQLREAVVRSPVEGVVWRRSDGRTVSAGSEVCTVADSASIIVEAELDAAWRGRIKVGDSARVRIGNAEIAATVRAVEPSVSETADLAWQPLPSAAGMRVLLDVDARYRTALEISAPVRVAITGPELGWFGHMALTLRF